MNNQPAQVVRKAQGWQKRHRAKKLWDGAVSIPLQHRLQNSLPIMRTVNIAVTQATTFLHA